MILSLFFPHVLVQVRPSPPEAGPAFGLPFPRVLLFHVHGSHVVLLQHEQPLELGVLVDDAE